MSLQKIARSRRGVTNVLYSMIRGSTGEAGDGAGRGGGTGGSIRDAGGAFGKMEAAHEEQYFRRLQAEQIKELKKGLHKEVEFHEAQIKEHKAALERHKDRLDTLSKHNKHK